MAGTEPLPTRNANLFGRRGRVRWSEVSALGLPVGVLFLGVLPVLSADGPHEMVVRVFGVLTLIAGGALAGWVVRGWVR